MLARKITGGSAGRCDSVQRLTALAQLVDFVEHFLFGRVWFEMLSVGGQGQPN